MQSRAHAAIGGVVSLAAVAVIWPAPSWALSAALLTYGVALSVLLDLDHFVVARLLVGDWRHLRRVLADPTGVLGDQSWLFADVADLARPRLASHAVLGSLLVAGTWAVTARFGAFSAIVLAAHVGADLLRDAELA